MSKPAPKRKARNRNRGVLAYQQLRALVHDGVISAKAPIESGQYQPASLDLRLGDTAYRMFSSFLPEQAPVEQKLVVQDLFSSDLVMYELDLRKSAVLEKGHVYLIPLMEELALPRTLAAKTNPKSTTGRLDVFARTITDSHARFDEIRPGYRGKLYLEVVPRSFSIRISTGMCLNQLRVVSGHPMVGDNELRTRHKADPILYGDHAPLPGKEPLLGPVTAAAERLGVRPGMRMGEALASCPGLVLVEQDPASAEQAWEEILRALEDSGFAVDSAEPGTVYFETRGVERLYGGLEAALKRALAAVGTTWDARIGAAERRFAARHFRPARPGKDRCCRSRRCSRRTYPGGGGRAPRRSPVG